MNKKLLNSEIWIHFGSTYMISFFQLDLFPDLAIIHHQTNTISVRDGGMGQKGKVKWL
jgi:hypothetical protein